MTKNFGKSWSTSDGPSLLIPEEYGGQGGSFLDMTVIAEEAGKALVPGPFFTSALLGAPLVIERRLRRAEERNSPANGEGRVHRHPRAG